MSTASGNPTPTRDHHTRTENNMAHIRLLLDHIDNSSQLAERLIADLNAAG